MRNINERYIFEEYNKKNELTNIHIQTPDNFNFAYDVVDDIAQHDPHRRAMLWCNPEGEEHTFTFSDIKKWSDKTANFLAQQGIGKGSYVLVILRRHYQFWFTAIALAKLGAVMVPATFMLKQRDIEYRIQRANIQAVIATSLGDIADVIDAAAPNCPSLGARILVNGGTGGLGGEKDTTAGSATAGSATAGSATAGSATAGSATAQTADIDSVASASSVITQAIDTATASTADNNFASPTVEKDICSLAAKRKNWLDFNTEVRAASSSFARRETLSADPMLMYFSSGTTGEPKMVLHNSSYALAHLVTAKHWHCVEPDGLHFTIADTGWGKAVWGKLYGQWLMEAAIFTYDFDRFHAKDILDIISKYKITTLCCPPTMYRMLMLEDIDSFDLSSLKHTTTAGEALSPDLFNLWQKHTGLKIYEGFGQTETPLCIGNLRNSIPRCGSMGKPVPLYTVAVLRKDNTPCDKGQAGEICIKLDKHVPGIMMEYYCNPERTSMAKQAGWYHTGDVAWEDEDGYLWYIGRNDDVIKSSGYRIGPFEIESVLLEHEAVCECAITGIPDPLRGKAVKATIVLNNGFKESPDLTRELQLWVKNQTAPYKYPRVVEYVHELPKTVNGKISRTLIRENNREQHNNDY